MVLNKKISLGIIWLIGYRKIWSGKQYQFNKGIIFRYPGTGPGRKNCEYAFIAACISI